MPSELLNLCQSLAPSEDVQMVRLCWLICIVIWGILSTGRMICGTDFIHPGRFESNSFGFPMMCAGTDKEIAGGMRPAVSPKQKTK